MSRKKYTFVTLSSSVPLPVVAATARSSSYGPCQSRSDRLSLSEASGLPAVDTSGVFRSNSPIIGQGIAPLGGGEHPPTRVGQGPRDCSAADVIRKDDGGAASRGRGDGGQTTVGLDRTLVKLHEAFPIASSFSTARETTGEPLLRDGTSSKGQPDEAPPHPSSSRPLVRLQQGGDKANEAPGSGTGVPCLALPNRRDDDARGRKIGALSSGGAPGSTGEPGLPVCPEKESLCSEGEGFAGAVSCSSAGKGREGVSSFLPPQNRAASLSSGTLPGAKGADFQRISALSSLSSSSSSRVSSLAVPSFHDARLPAVAREDAAAMLRDFACLLQRLEQLGSHHRHLQQSVQVRACSVSSSGLQHGLDPRAELEEARRQLKQHAVICASLSARLGRLFAEEPGVVSLHGSTLPAAPERREEEDKKNNGLGFLGERKDSKREEDSTVADAERGEEAARRGDAARAVVANQRRRLLLSKLRQDFFRLQQHHERLMLLFDNFAFSSHSEKPSRVGGLPPSASWRQEESQGVDRPGVAQQGAGQKRSLLDLIDFDHFAQQGDGDPRETVERVGRRSEWSPETLCPVQGSPQISGGGSAPCVKVGRSGRTLGLDENASSSRSCGRGQGESFQTVCVASGASSSPSSFSSVRLSSCSASTGLSEPRYLPLPAPEDMPFSPSSSSFCSLWRPTCLQEVDEGLEEAQRREQLQQLKELEQCVHVLHELHLQVASDVAAAEEPLLSAADEGESARAEIAQANRELISANMRRSRWWGVQGGGAAAAAGAIVGVVAGGPIGLAAGAVVGAFLGASSGAALRREHRKKLTGLRKDIEERRRGRRERKGRDEGGAQRAGLTQGTGSGQTRSLLDDDLHGSRQSEGWHSQHAATSLQMGLRSSADSSSCPPETLRPPSDLVAPPVSSSRRSRFPAVSGSRSGASSSYPRLRAAWTPSVAAFGVAAAPWPVCAGYGKPSRTRVPASARSFQSLDSVSSSVFTSSYEARSPGNNPGRSEQPCSRGCAVVDTPPAARFSDRRGPDRLEVSSADTTMRYRRLSADPRVPFFQSPSTAPRSSEEERGGPPLESARRVESSAGISSTCMTATSITTPPEGDKGQRNDSVTGSPDKKTWHSVFSFKPSVFSWTRDSRPEINTPPRGGSSCMARQSHGSPRPRGGQAPGLSQHLTERPSESSVVRGLHQRTTSRTPRTFCDRESCGDTSQIPGTDTRLKSTGESGDDVAKHPAASRREGLNDEEASPGGAIWGGRGGGGLWSGPPGAWQWNVPNKVRRNKGKGREERSKAVAE